MVWQLLRDLAARRFKSLYMINPFLQFLGIYSHFNVPWDKGIHNILEALSFFNLNMGTLALPCLGLDYVALSGFRIIMRLPFDGGIGRFSCAQSHPARNRRRCGSRRRSGYPCSTQSWLSFTFST